MLGVELAFVAGLVISVGSVIPSRLSLTPAEAAKPDAIDAHWVAGHPRAYRGEEVAVAGVVGKRPRRRAARDRWAFLLRGHGGGRLFVVAARGHPLAVFRTGTRVVVHGRFSVPRHRRHAAPASRSAVAARSHAAGVLEAERITLDR